VKLAGEDPEDVEPFWGAVGNYSLGEQFHAFGYPEDVAADKPGPTPRLFTGHFQRFFDYRSFAGFRYRAGELSLPAPAGLSGGPLFRPGAAVMVTGLVAENFESRTTLDSVEEVSREGDRTTYSTVRVIAYGVAVMLDPLSGWLDEHVPAFDSSEFVRRREARARR
jgi:hypothetical protein